MKTSRFTFRMISALTLYFISTFTFGQTIENSLFWEISGNGLKKPSYLFGTYHLLNNGYLEETPAVKRAFNNATGIVVETELDSSKMMQLISIAIMPNKKISALVSAEEYELISNEVGASAPIPMAMLEQFKPNFISVLLSVQYAQEEVSSILGKYKGQPLDSYFAQAGRKSSKTVTTFETAEEQMRILFDHDPVEKQAKQLVELIKTKEEAKAAQVDLTRMYFEQNLNGMYDLYKKYSIQFGDASFLLDDRNIKWMEKLPEILKQGNQFIAVGALHFTGDKSLITLLREAGYTVRPAALK